MRKQLRSMVNGTQTEISDKRISNMSHRVRQAEENGHVFTLVIDTRHNTADLQQSFLSKTKLAFSSKHVYFISEKTTVDKLR